MITVILTSVKDKTTTIATKKTHVSSLFSICKSNFQVIIKLEITVQVGLRLETRNTEKIIN